MHAFFCAKNLITAAREIIVAYSFVLCSKQHTRYLFRL